MATPRRSRRDPPAMDAASASPRACPFRNDGRPGDARQHLARVLQARDRVAVGTAVRRRKQRAMASPMASIVRRRSPPVAARRSAGQNRRTETGDDRHFIEDVFADWEHRLGSDNRRWQDPGLGSLQVARRRRATSPASRSHGCACLRQTAATRHRAPGARAPHRSIASRRAPRLSRS